MHQLRHDAQKEEPEVSDKHSLLLDEIKKQTLRQTEM